MEIRYFQTGGMLLAGAAPVDAFRLQLVLLYVLLGSVALAALIAVTLAQRRFISSAHQLRELAPTATQRACGQRALCAP